MSLVFNLKYLFLTVLLFAVEICIALFAGDQFVRPFVGDTLIVALAYCFVRIFLDVSYLKAAFAVLLFAFTIEILQYFDYVKLLGLENNRILSVAMGRSFEWLDFVAYFCGFLLIVLVEFFYERNTARQSGRRTEPRKS